MAFYLTLTQLYKYIYIYFDLTSILPTWHFAWLKFWYLSNTLSDVWHFNWWKFWFYLAQIHTLSSDILCYIQSDILSDILSHNSGILSDRYILASMPCDMLHSIREICWHFISTSTCFVWHIFSHITRDILTLRHFIWHAWRFFCHSVWHFSNKLIITRQCNLYQVDLRRAWQSIGHFFQPSDRAFYLMHIQTCMYVAFHQAF